MLSNALSTETSYRLFDRSVPLQLNRVSGALRDNTGIIDAFFIKQLNFRRQEVF